MSRRSSDLKGLVESIRHAFRKVKGELEDHLGAINENSSDIHEIHETVSELDHKIDKLAERLDELELCVNPKKFRSLSSKLTPREQEVFMALYVGKSMSLSQISKRLGFTADMVNLYLFNLTSKGVPLQKELLDDVLVFSIDPEFKDLQARRNVLNIDPRVSKQMVAQEF